MIELLVHPKKSGYLITHIAVFIKKKAIYFSASNDF